MNEEKQTEIPLPPGGGVALSGKIVPAPAPLLFRTLAFCADGVLVFLATMLALKLFLPIVCPTGFAVCMDYWTQISAAYEAAAADAARGVVATERLNELVAAASQDETLASFFETVNTISFLLAVLYFVLTEQFMRGQTLGKKIFGLRTVTAGTEEPPRFLQTLSRAFWKAISVVPVGIILTLLAIVNAHVIVFARRHRGWHDKLARTEVVDTKRKVLIVVGPKK